MDVAKLDFGCELITGLPGSGKSLYAVRRSIEQVRTSRRPCYTNLPIKWRVMRAYLRILGGEDLANLYRKLNEEHWRRFLVRQHAFARMRERLSKRTPADLHGSELAEFASALGKDPGEAQRLPKFYHTHLVAWFEAKNGPNIVDGPDANWIPPGSIICIDEAHHWHPAAKQADDPNRPDLLAYITMCRHHLHWLWIITQDEANVAIEFRRHFHYMWRVWDRAEDVLAWNIRWRSLGLRALGYRKLTPDEADAKAAKNHHGYTGGAIQSFTLLPWLPRNRVLFRLYSSHTNLGSARQLRRELERAREAAGLRADGATREDLEMAKKREAQRIKEPRGRRVVRRLRTLVVVLGASSVAFGAGRGIGSGKKDAPEQAPAAEPVDLGPVEWPVWQAAASRPWIDGRRVEPGAMLTPRVRLDYVDEGGRALVLRVDDREWWMWRWREPAPIRVGPIEDVRASVERLRGEADTDGGRATLGGD